ncbi:MAG: hypothetical protein R6W83_01730 [Cryobacterium sp.]
MTSFRPARFLGILTGTVVILGIGVYGPATLLGPLPDVTMTMVVPEAAALPLSPPRLPGTGASAITIVSSSDVAATETPSTPREPLAVAGTAEAVPMASAAKLITALVVLDARPVTDAANPSITLTAEDYQDYLDYDGAGARTVTVFADEVWTEQEMLQALLLGSSNNHADTLARWAFSSVDAYVAAANTWLDAHGLTETRVVDATGLDARSTGSAADLARLAAIAAGDPVVSGIIAAPATALASRRGVDNTTEFLPDLGVTGLSRSYTDAGGVCFLFTAAVVTGESTFTFAGAMIGQPDYDTLTAAVTTLMDSAVTGVTELPLLALDAPYASFESVWGRTVFGVVAVAQTRVGWSAVAVGDPVVTADPFATGRAGDTVGRVTVDTGSSDTVSSPLKLDGTLRDPGPGWRLLNPVPLITALIQSRS